MAQSPEAWRQTAVGLRRAADLIWQKWYVALSRFANGPASFSADEVWDILLLPTYLLLFGLGIENLLKGLIVARNPSEFSGVLKWKVGKGGHDLSDLAGNAGILVRSDDTRLLEALTEAVVWAGRYPVRKKHEDSSDWEISFGQDFEFSTAESIVPTFSDYKRKCDELFSRIHGEYTEKQSKPPVQ